MKKFISLILALSLCVSVIACSSNGDNTTQDGSTTVADSTSDISTTVGKDTTSDNAQTTGSDTTTSGTQTTEPEITFGENDVVDLKVGNYINLIYNPAYCQITTSVEKGVGSRESVTLSITMKDGYTFNGWSKDKAISNGGTRSSKATEYTITVNNETTVWANYSATIYYYGNGGTNKNGGEIYTQTPSVVWYKCPSTLNEGGYFIREGYTLVEYNTKSDGTGTAISLGSRVVMNDQGIMKLYCIWEKQNDESDFTVKASGTSVSITKYKGTATNVVIPETIGGKMVTTICADAFTGSKIERVVLNKNITTIEDGAFKNCTKLETLVMFDSLMNVSDSSFSGSPLKNLRVNAVLGMYDNWTTSWGNPKMDRLLWAAAKDSDIIAIYGGSGSYYGFDCATIDEALGGKYDIVNLGSNANVSSSLYFEYLNEVMGEGDIVLWSPEAGHYTLGSTSFSNRTWEFNAGNYDIFRNIDISKYSGVFYAYRTYAASHAASQKSFDAFDPNTNSYGDGTSEREHKDQTYNYSITSYTNALDKGTYSYIASLMKEMSEKGIKIYYTYAAMDKEGVGYNDDIMADYEAALVKAFPNLVVISEYKDCLVPHEYMFDSAWHMTLDGAKTRTQVVIRDLLAQLEKEGS